MMRSIDLIVVHCSATPEGRDVTAKDIDAMHKARGFAKIGYHYFTKLDGTVEKGREESEIGAHAEGNNSRSIGVCYAGGVAKDGKTPKDTRTPAQKAALLKLLTALKAKYSKARILGHRDLPKVAKACPSFDAKTEYASIGAVA